MDMDIQKGMIIKTMFNDILIVTDVLPEEIHPIKVIHISKFRKGKINGYSRTHIKEIIGTAETHPEYML